MIIVFVPGDEMALEAQDYRMAMAGENIFGEKGLHVEIFFVAIPNNPCMVYLPTFGCF